MNLALPALIILGLTLPGLIFVYTYKGALRNQNAPLVSGTSMTMGWVLAIFAALVSHLVWVPISEWITGFGVDLKAIAILVSGHYDNHEAFMQSVDSVVKHPYRVGGYFITLYAASASAGIVFHQIVRRNRLDLRIGFLRFNNPWHYLFWGQEQNVSGAWIAVSVRHANHSCIYTGFISQYALSADGQLERLVLRQPVFRLSLPIDCTEATSHCEIPGDHFVIWAKDINTLNVDYIYAASS